MSNKSSRNTREHKWSYFEGTIITVSIILLGFAFQAFSGGILLRPSHFPWNLILGIAFVTILTVLYWLFKKHSFVQWLGSVKAALPAIFGFTFLVLLMGFVKQDVEPHNNFSRMFGLTHLVQTWPFILINLYLMILLGVVTLKRLTPFNLKNAGFFVNHFGLFLVLFSTSLGSGDMQRLTMNCYENKIEQHAIDNSGKMVELPIAIELLKFDIDEFRPKVTIIENKSGKIVLAKAKDQFVIMDRDSFSIGSYQIKIEQFLETSGKTGTTYSQMDVPGSAPSALVKVTSQSNDSVISGWMCSGSYAMHPEALKLNESHSLVMLPAEPRKFSSELKIQLEDGEIVNTTIEVNKPFSIGGWTIYQLGYDTELGRWSNLSILELVRDPWLPLVYFGIFLMMAGAVFLFVTGKPKSGGTEHVE